VCCQSPNGVQRFTVSTTLVCVPGEQGFPPQISPHSRHGSVVEDSTKLLGQTCHAGGNLSAALPDAFLFFFFFLDASHGHQTLLHLCSSPLTSSARPLTPCRSALCVFTWSLHLPCLSESDTNGYRKLRNDSLTGCDECNRTRAVMVALNSSKPILTTGSHNKFGDRLIFDGFQRATVEV
jgi:hypothetical protein